MHVIWNFHETWWIKESRQVPVKHVYGLNLGIAATVSAEALYGAPLTTNKINGFIFSSAQPSRLAKGEELG